MNEANARKGINPPCVATTLIQANIGAHQSAKEAKAFNALDLVLAVDKA